MAISQSGYERAKALGRLSRGVAQLKARQPILEAEVKAAVKGWRADVLEIGRIAAEDGDYRGAAANLVARRYGFDYGPVVFGPATRAAEAAPDARRAIDFFAGRAADAELDAPEGFALRPWVKMTFLNVQIARRPDTAHWMARGFLFPADGTEAAIGDIAFGFFRDPQGALRINLHMISGADLA